jgi:molybdopterin-guanine dinucleotide biosynthesis protein A
LLETDLPLDIKISGAILAGGDNKRFGGIPKSNIFINGEKIISRIVRTLSDIFEELIIVTNTPSDFREYSRLIIVKDHFLKAGPLGGIHSALKASSGDAVFVIAGDMPFPDKKIITQMNDRYKHSDYDIFIPRINGLIEPLHAIYNTSLLPDLEQFISTNKSRAIRDFVNSRKAGYLEMEPSESSKKAFTNINSQSDLEKLGFDLYI